MSKSEKAHPTVGAVEQARTGNVLEDSYSRDHCTSNPVAGQIKISDFLSAGQENAVPLRHLKTVTGLDGRTVRLMIQRERLAGFPILADNQTGYYLPATQEEKQRCVHSMRHRAEEIKRAALAIEAADFQQSLNVECREQATATKQESIGGWFDA